MVDNAWSFNSSTCSQNLRSYMRCLKRVADCLFWLFCMGKRALQSMLESASIRDVHSMLEGRYASRRWASRA